jgi:methyl-accepting chemotaxis protein
MKWFYNLKTSAKLMIGFALMAAAVAISGFIGVTSLEKTNEMLRTTQEKHLVGLSYIASANIDQLRSSRAVRNVILASTREEAERQSASMESEYESSMNGLKDVDKTMIKAEGKAKVAAVVQAMPEWHSFNRLARDLALAGKKQEALDALAKGASVADKVKQGFDGLVEQKVNIAEEAYKDSQSLYSASRLNLIVICVVSIIAGMLMGLWMGRLIGNSLNQAVTVLEAVAARDFTQSLDIDTTDEVGRMAGALNEAVRGVQQAMLEVRDVADSVANASRELSSSAEEIASGAQEQASSLEETAANLEEITATVKQSAENAQQASQLGSGARDTAEKGGAVVSDAVEAMGEINKSSKRIADIISTIDEIAFQTNLLALNAAVEAARAGEQGRGFAVVAAEVRNLAQRSAGAAKEIKDLIGDSVRKVEGGSELVNQSGQRLQEIVASVKRVTDLVAEMASASREQSSGIDQVNKAVAQMDQVTQANSAQTEELSGTAESMNQQAEQLRKLVAQFRLGDEGTRRTSESRRSPRPAARPIARTRGSQTGYNSGTKKLASPAPARKPEPSGEAHKEGNGAADLDAAMLSSLTNDIKEIRARAGDFEDV